MTAVLDRTAWLASYAVGLAYTHQSDEACIEQLLEVAPDSEELRVTAAQLARLHMHERDRHRRAQRLVRLARRRLDVAAVPTGAA